MEKELTNLRKKDFEDGVAHERQIIIDYCRSLAWIYAEFDGLADALEGGEHVAAVKRQN